MGLTISIINVPIQAYIVQNALPQSMKAATTILVALKI